MRLPEGVRYRPRQERLVGINEAAWIEIDTDRHAQNVAYEPVGRRLEEDVIAPYLMGDWNGSLRKLDLEQYVPGPAFATLLHRGHPRLPTISVLPNLRLQASDGRRGRGVLGCTMGQLFDPPETDASRVERVYEFQAHAMLVLHPVGQRPELWVGEAGDKVAVPAGCHITVYNLGDEHHPLVMLDFGHGHPAPTAPSALARKFGPILLGSYDDFEVVWRLNGRYLNNESNQAAVTQHGFPSGPAAREIRIRRGARLDLGPLLHHELRSNPDVIGRFRELGFKIQRAKPEVELGAPLSHDGKRKVALRFTRPLVDATRPGNAAHDYFLNHTEGEWRSDEVPTDPAEEHGYGSQHGILLAHQRRMAAIANIIEARAKSDPDAEPSYLQIVVEGVGQWVVVTFRPMFEEMVQNGADLSVYYINDSTWQNKPSWAEMLEPWECYLDKDDPRSRGYYGQLTPDVVYIVTPDSTHCDIAKVWLGRTPLVLVEKPFDSHLGSIMRLWDASRRHLGTRVLGLDHYLSYAATLWSAGSELIDHLRGRPTEVSFFLTEGRPIEAGRERTLRHGLTLDLLPHCLALLTFFGDVATVDDIQVIRAQQYEPLESEDAHGERRDITGQFPNETRAHVRFTLEDHGRPRRRLLCNAVVGKGVDDPAKYLHVCTDRGYGLRIDLSREPAQTEHVDYPWDSVFVTLPEDEDPPAGLGIDKVVDPYDEGRLLRILKDPQNVDRFRVRLDRRRYHQLLAYVIGLRSGAGTTDALGAVSGTLQTHEATEIVASLDRIWSAVQTAQPWSRYPLPTPQRAASVTESQSSDAPSNPE